MIISGRLVILFLVVFIGRCCHYSCDTCYMGNSFVNCTSCVQGNFTILYDPDKNQTQNFYVHNYTGVCAIPTDPVINVYGIIMLALAVCVAIYIRKRETLLFINRIQNIAIMSLLGVGFISPISYVLQGLQYFFLFTKVTLSAKTSDLMLQENGYYNLQTFIDTIDYVSNVIALDVFIGIVGVLLLIVIFVESMCIDKVQDD
jgi:hypothetical protein